MFASDPGVTVGVVGAFAVAVGVVGAAAGVGDTQFGALCASTRRLPRSSPALPVDGILIVAGEAASTGGGATGAVCATVCAVAGGHGAVNAAVAEESLCDVAAPEATATETAAALTPRTTTETAHASFMLAPLRVPYLFRDGYARRGNTDSRRCSRLTNALDAVREHLTASRRRHSGNFAERAERSRSGYVSLSRLSQIWL